VSTRPGWFLYIVGGATLAATVPLAINQWTAWSERRDQQAEAQRYLQLGSDAVAAGDWVLAERTFGWAQGLSASPEAAARLLRARAEQVLTDPLVLDADAATRLHAELALALKSARGAEATTLTLALGRVLTVRGQGAKALELYRDQVKQDDTSALAHLFLGDALLKSGKLDEAAPEASRALDLKPDLPLGLFVLGQIRLGQKRFDEAADLLNRAAQAMPRSAQAFASLGQARFELKQHDAARVAFETALGLDGKLGGVHANLGRCYARLGQGDAAVGALRLAWERGADVGAYLDLGRLLLQLSRVEEAVPVFRHLDQLDPKNPEPSIALAMVAESSGNLEAAAALLAAAEKRVSALEDKGEWPRAIAARRQALSARSAEGPKKR